MVIEESDGEETTSVSPPRESVDKNVIIENGAGVGVDRGGDVKGGGESLPLSKQGQQSGASRVGQGSGGVESGSGEPTTDSLKDNDSTGSAKPVLPTAVVKPVQRQGGTETVAPVPDQSPPLNNTLSAVVNGVASVKTDLPPAYVAPAPELPVKVSALKDEGNKLFKAGQYSDALDKYNRAIKLLEGIAHILTLFIK